MIHWPACIALLLPVLVSCASPPSAGGPAPQPLGAPPAVVDRPGAAVEPGATEPALLPDRIAIPATYRLILLDGHLELVRESDPQAMAPTPASLRVITGEVARGELAFQPGLLPQELAREVAANRESSARMDNALADVMARSRDLADQALRLQADSRNLSARLAAAEARVRELEARPGAGPREPPPKAVRPDPDN